MTKITSSQLQAGIRDAIFPFQGEPVTSENKSAIRQKIMGYLVDLQANGFLNVPSLPLIDINNEKEIEYLNSRIELLQGEIEYGPLEDAWARQCDIACLTRLVDSLRVADPNVIRVTFKHPTNFSQWRGI